MPWKAQSGNIYNLCLLDTNALSEIVKRPEIEGRGFLERFPPNSFVPCFTVYNLIEIRRKQEVFKAFTEFFSVYPCFILKATEMLLEEENEAEGNLSSVSPLLNAFSPLGENASYDFSHFVNELFQNEEISRIEKNWRHREFLILKDWLNNKLNFISERNVPNAKDASKYIKWVQKQTEAVDKIGDMPALKVMLYSKYYRLYDKNWKPRPQEVTDVMIIAAAPYMDVIITESFQAEILKKVKNEVKGLENAQFITLRELRKKI